MFYQIFPDRLYQADKHAEPFWQPNDRRPPERGPFRRRFRRASASSSPPAGNGRLFVPEPIFEAHSNHRYNTADYLNVDPLLGTNEEFEVLAASRQVRHRHRAGRCKLSHTGSDSRCFNREGRYGEGGATATQTPLYRSWYDFDPKYKGIPQLVGLLRLPEVNEGDPPLWSSSPARAA